MQSRTFYYQPDLLLSKNDFISNLDKHQEYLNAVKSNDNLISERTQNPFKLQPFEIKAVKMDSHNRGLEMDKSVRIIDQSKTSQRFYANPKYSPNNYSTISGVNSKDPASRKSRNFDESRFKSNKVTCENLLYCDKVHV